MFTEVNGGTSNWASNGRKGRTPTSDRQRLPGEGLASWGCDHRASRQLSLSAAETWELPLKLGLTPGLHWVPVNTAGQDVKGVRTRSDNSVTVKMTQLHTYGSERVQRQILETLGKFYKMSQREVSVSKSLP